MEGGDVGVGMGEGEGVIYLDLLGQKGWVDMCF